MKKKYREIFKLDLSRYNDKAPHYEKRLLRLLRRAQNSKGIFRTFSKTLYILHCKKRNIELPIDVSIGPGFYLGHAFGITVNPEVSIGKNCNIHKKHSFQYV